MSGFNLRDASGTICHCDVLSITVKIAQGMVTRAGTPDHYVLYCEGSVGAPGSGANFELYPPDRHGGTTRLLAGEEVRVHELVITALPADRASKEIEQ